MKGFYSLGAKLNLPYLAVAMMIPTIATASTTTAIVLNSGIAVVPIISILSEPAGKLIDNVLMSADVSFSTGSVNSESSINAAKFVSFPSAVLASMYGSWLL